MSRKKKIAILGSTGSIGRQTLEVIKRFPDRFEVVGLSAGGNFNLLSQQIETFRPCKVSLAREEDAEKLAEEMPDYKNNILCGEAGMEAIATMPEVEVVVAAVVGFKGLKPVISAIKTGKNIALANKETLVAAGEIIRRIVSENNVALLPIDSEHSAIFQCLQGESRKQLERIILTASGGPFWGWSKEKLGEVTPEEALRHPVWSMGSKVTIDSATLMNKGLEIIEARWLFEVELSRIEVLIHPQSIIHSMVEFIDGSIIAQLSLPDMRLPIQYALTYPERLPGSFPRLNLASIKELTFYEPEYDKFPCLQLAQEALAIGGTMPVVLNAANEQAVELFLDRRIGFMDIPRIIDECMNRHTVVEQPDIDDVFSADAWAREYIKAGGKV